MLVALGINIPRVVAMCVSLCGKVEGVLSASGAPLALGKAEGCIWSPFWLISNMSIFQGKYGMCGRGGGNQVVGRRKGPYLTFIESGVTPIPLVR